MKFKEWLHLQENLSGPGGGPEGGPNDLEGYYKDITNKEAGAFHQGGGNPPPTGKSPTAKYLDPKYRSKMMMKKKMKK